MAGRTELADGVENELDLRTGARCVIASEDLAQGRKFAATSCLRRNITPMESVISCVEHGLLVESGCSVLRQLRVVVRFAEEGGGPFEEFRN